MTEIRQNQAEPSPDVLTSRETEVLRGLAEGKSNKEVAARLGISPRTIDAHRAHISWTKLRVRTLKATWSTSQFVHQARRLIVGPVNTNRTFATKAAYVDFTRSRAARPAR